MCGIAGIHVLDSKKAAKLDLSRLAAELLLSVDHRGGDATGAACTVGDVVHVAKASDRARVFLSEWAGVPSGARTVLLHTRYATHGSPAFAENNHPVSSGDVYVVHNGVIRNDRDVFEDLGVRRIGRVDSEAIPAAIAAAGWAKAPRAFERLDGDFAIGAVSSDHPRQLWLARAGWSPLVWYRTGTLLVWASEATALHEAWTRTFGRSPSWERTKYLDEGEAIRVSGSRITPMRFTPKPRPKAKVWTSTKTCTPKPSNGSSRTPAPKLGETLGRALEASQGSRPGSVHVWDPATQGWEDPDFEDLDLVKPWDTAEVRCACCSQWTDAIVMREAFGEMVCEDCHTILVEEELVAR